MELLVVTDDLTAYPAPELSTIDEFHRLIKRDKGTKGDYRGTKKLQATRELAYIWHMVSWKSPYANYVDELREEKIRQDVFKDSGWEPDEIVIAAMDKYRELTTSQYILLLESGTRAAQKLIDFFDGLDLTTLDKNDRPIYHAKDLIANLANIGKVVEGLIKLREQVNMDSIGQDRMRKSVEVNQFSQ